MSELSLNEWFDVEHSWKMQFSRDGSDAHQPEKSNSANCNNSCRSVGGCRSFKVLNWCVWHWTDTTALRQNYREIFKEIYESQRKLFLLSAMGRKVYFFGNILIVSAWFKNYNPTIYIFGSGKDFKVGII